MKAKKKDIYKYRGFSHKHNKWLYGDLKYRINNTFIRQTGTKKWIKVIKNSVDRFINETDSNGTEIYVNDVVNFNNGASNKCYHVKNETAFKIHKMNEYKNDPDLKIYVGDNLIEYLPKE